MHDDCPVFQTLEYRDNNEEVEHHGPYECRRRDAWLGEGYYFWEDDIEAARRWGKHGCHNLYIIAESSYDYYNHNFLDLVGNPNDMRDFRRVLNALRIATPDMVITVAKAIQFMKSELKDGFNFVAIRSRSERRSKDDEVPYSSSKAEWININPEIQLCVLEPKSFLTAPFSIIYKSEACSHAFGKE